MWHHWFQDIPLLLVLKELWICVGVFYPRMLFTLHFLVLCVVQQVLQILADVFYPQAFFTFLSFCYLFAITYIYQGFPGNWRFYLEGSRTFILRFETQFQSNCSFESHSIREHISPLFQTRTLVVMNVVSY